MQSMISDTTSESRKYLVETMNKRFKNKTFEDYIMNDLAGDFTVSLANMIRADRATIRDLRQLTKNILDESISRIIRQAETCEFFEFAEDSDPAPEKNDFVSDGDNFDFISRQPREMG